MAKSTTPNPHGVAMLLYKEMRPGDIRKIRAQSNDAPSGGGARDFRFGSFAKVRPALEKMFPTKTMELRKRDGKQQNVAVGKGTFSWDENGTVRQQESFFEAPTDARPSEGRIVRIHQQPCLNASLIPTPGPNNRVLLLLVQRNDASVWPYYVTEQSLRTPGAWDQEVAAELVRCLDAKRAPTTSVIGYCDMQTGKRYCNGK